MECRGLGLVVAATAANALLLLMPCIYFGIGDREAGCRLLTFLAAATALCVADCLAPANERGDVLPPRAADRKHAWLALATGVLLLLLFWSAIGESHLRSASPAIVLSTFGALLMFSGVGLRAVAIGTLRERFRTEIAVPSTRDFVDTGIYRWLRHPSETGLLLVALGASTLFSSSCAFLLTLAGLLPLVLCRLRCEEAELLAAFGPAYAAYRQQTPALIPWRYPSGLAFPERAAFGDNAGLDQPPQDDKDPSQCCRALT